MKHYLYGPLIAAALWAVFAEPTEAGNLEPAWVERDPTPPAQECKSNMGRAYALTHPECGGYTPRDPRKPDVQFRYLEQPGSAPEYRFVKKGGGKTTPISEAEFCKRNGC